MSDVFIVKQPLFQKVPKEKQTADPPITINEFPLDTTEVPIRRGRGSTADIFTRVGEMATPGSGLSDGRKQTSSETFKISFFTTPPNMYIRPSWLMVVAPNLAICAICDLRS